MKTIERSIYPVLLGASLMAGASATPQPGPESAEERVAFLETIYSSSPRLEGASIQVTLQDHIVLLSGSVLSLDQAEFAASIALATDEIFGTVNRVEVIGRETTAEVLQTEINRSIAASTALDPTHLSVSMDGHVAVLNGSVSTLDERELAREFASRVPGIKAIDNRIDVDFREPRSDAAIKAQLETQLQDDPLFDLLPIRFEVSNGTVTLSGQVGSRDEMDRLQRTSWVTGISDVDASSITIDPDLRMEGMEDKNYHPSDSLKVLQMVFEADPRVDAADLKSEIVNGTAILSGTVLTAAARAAAESDARGVPGILGVINRIELARPTLSSR